MFTFNYFGIIIIFEMVRSILRILKHSWVDESQTSNLLHVRWSKVVPLSVNKKVNKLKRDKTNSLRKVNKQLNKTILFIWSIFVCYV